MKRVESVLFVTTSYPRFPNDFPGIFVHRFAKCLVRDGVRVTVLAPAAPGHPAEDEIEGVRIHRFTYSFPYASQCLAYGEGGGILGNLRRSWLARCQVPTLMTAMTLAVRRHQASHDLVHCHWLPTAAATLAARRLSRVKRPIVFTNWGSDTRNTPHWLTRTFISRVDGCVSTAVSTDQALLKAGRKDFARIGTPGDEERFDPQRVDTGLRAELGIEAKVPVIAFVARLVPFKDPLTFLQACGVLQARGVSFHALVVGDGKLMPQCREEVDRLGLDDIVHLLGMRDDPERAYQIATLSVHISPLENTWSTTITEAMFMKVPVVLTDVGHTKETFTHERDCLLVPPRDPQRLADAVERLLNRPAEREQLVQGALELLARHGKDSQSTTRALRDYYDSVANTFGNNKK